MDEKAKVFKKTETKKRQKGGRPNVTEGDSLTYSYASQSNIWLNVARSILS